MCLGFSAGKLVCTQVMMIITVRGKERLAKACKSCGTEQWQCLDVRVKWALKDG